MVPESSQLNNKVNSFIFTTKLNDSLYFHFVFERDILEIHLKSLLKSLKKSSNY